MNLLFQTRKPRRFHHEAIYSDERKARLQRLEQQARRELGEKPGKGNDDHAGLSFNFEGDRRMRSRQQWGLFISILRTLVMLFVLFILVLLLLL